MTSQNPDLKSVTTIVHAEMTFQFSMTTAAYTQDEMVKWDSTAGELIQLHTARRHFIEQSLENPKLCLPPPIYPFLDRPIPNSEETTQRSIN
jgi:hypothetical protein